MNLKFKKPSKETQIAMSKVASGDDNHDYHSLAEEKLANITNHHYAKLVSSGNSAILSAMNSIDGSIIIPDQGAWNGFKQIANLKGVIDLVTEQLGGNTWQDILDKALDEATKLMQEGLKDSYVITMKNQIVIGDAPNINNMINCRQRCCLQT